MSSYFSSWAFKIAIFVLFLISDMIIISVKQTALYEVLFIL